MRPMRIGIVTLLILTTAASAADDRVKRAVAWEPEFKSIEARRKRESPAVDAPVFLGSSSFRLWDTAKDLPEIKPFNAGFGGSEIRDTTQSLDRILGDAKPKYAVIYAGDNDINAKRTPRMVRDDFIELVTKLRAKFPGLPIAVLAIKPSGSRVAQLPKQREANKLVREVCEREPNMLFLDAEAEILDAQGKPRPELFKADRLHMSAKGYAIWAKMLREALKTWPAKS